ncbi:hypothetical protein HF877_06260 [Rhodococcus sp. BL-253-APC-6A1W]|uniref:hypothetical protein n=1 Tax=Rhodococcus sp. BL-253-APC-6A1W TaxID=2725307 RepID=UPI00146AB199|nr:hypothetical protein [Rhodococcus sp. BL-253-APC-6A1W]NMD95005.1 hypothetical protein [Rhodococcus sp. BL-253-APC-6A1W]
MATNENARPVLEHRTGSESNPYQEEGSMTDSTRYAVACQFDTGQVDQLGTFTTDVAAKDAAITHASTWADDLGTSMAFDPATMTATLGGGDVLEYRIVADSVGHWFVGVAPTLDCDETVAPPKVFRTYERVLVSDGNMAVAIAAVDFLIAGRLCGTEMQVRCEIRRSLSPRVARLLGSVLVQAADLAEGVRSFHCSEAEVWESL